jgi:3-oxoacyl-(acyl-carrier-protein) synthase
MTPIVVTGMGIVAAPGRGLAAIAAALREGRSGLGPLTRFPSPRCGGLPVAECRAVPPAAGAPRAAQLGACALGDAILDAGLDAAAVRDAALVVGTTVGGMPETEDALLRAGAGKAPDAAVARSHESCATTHAIARANGVAGPSSTVSNACSSGALAIATAADWLRAGAADVALAGGTDALCRLTLNGFASLLALDPRGCRPFDRARAGTSLGEGAAFVVLETAAGARARGRTPLAMLAGFAHTCDAFHATAPDPDGRGAEAAMRGALAMAGLEPGAIDYVNAHGTGTADNDRAEGRAIARVFAAAPAVSSTKRVFGHTLAAAGAIEAVVCVLAMRHGFLPASAGLDHADPDCAIAPLRATVLQRPRACLSNSFGFGGSNTVLCFVQPEAR